jgi:hypothetical protein
MSRETGISNHRIPVWEPVRQLVCRGIWETEEGGLLKRSVSLYGSTARGTWKECFTTWKYKGYAEEDTVTGISPHMCPVEETFGSITWQLERKLRFCFTKKPLYWGLREIRIWRPWNPASLSIRVQFWDSCGGLLYRGLWWASCDFIRRLYLLGTAKDM